MATVRRNRVALLYPGDRTSRESTAIGNPRLAPVGAALAGAGFTAEAAGYDDEWADEVRDQLLAVRGVLVWVDPITGSQDRTRLDALLREVAAAGVWVSAHPDVILSMGTKDVLYRTRELGWGADTHRYTSRAELEAGLVGRLGLGGARVLKQYRGNGGIGVWKVECADPPGGSPIGSGTAVVVQSARARDETVEQMPLGELIARLGKYFDYNDGQGLLIDQPFQPRIVEGLIRCYLVGTEVVGFARQYPDARPAAQVTAAGGDDAQPPRRVFGLPSAKTMFGPDEPAFRALRTKVEEDWVPGMQALLNLDAASLPVLWDADFLFGAKDEAGEDSYLLIEINVSAVTPFPEQAIPKIAEAVRRALPPED